MAGILRKIIDATKTGTQSVQSTPSDYGGSIINYGTNTGNDKVETVKQQIADLGQKWKNATSKSSRDAIHDQAAALGTGVGGVFNSRTGLWDFSNAAKSDTTTPPAGPSAFPAAVSYPSFTPPTTPELSWNDAMSRAGSQLDPMLQRALAGVDVNRYQDQLNTGEIAANYGGNHSGLAADAQGKVLIAASGKKADLQANRDATAAQMADALVARSQDRADRLRQQAFSEWSGQQDLGLRRDQFGWGQQIDTAGLTGNWNGQRTMAGQQMDWGQKIDESGMTGNWNGQRTLAGKAQDLDATQIMAALTGHLPNGQLTTAEQQRDLENLWKAADATGTIPDRLANVYGMQKGTKTLAAKQLAMNNSLDWFNANTSRSSANSSSSNAAFGRLTDIWAATGKAPAGLESYGVKPGDPYKPEVAAQLKPPTAESMRTYFDGMVSRDKDGKITNGADLEASILNSPVSDYDAYQLYLRYGLSWNGPVPSPN